MKLNDCIEKLKKLEGKKISEILQKDLNNVEQLKIDKGKVGQILLQYLGLPLDSKLTDFDDGELKTNKSDKWGYPLETMFITQISKNIDDYIHNPCIEFEKSTLFKKINNLVFLPVCKDSANYLDWFFTGCYRFEMEKNIDIYNKLKKDFYNICLSLHSDVYEKNFISTTPKGISRYLQVRAKDSMDVSGKYHPIFSSQLKRNISDKNHAFYFKKDFMKKVISLSKKIIT